MPNYDKYGSIIGLAIFQNGTGCLPRDPLAGDHVDQRNGGYQEAAGHQLIRPAALVSWS